MFNSWLWPLLLEESEEMELFFGGIPEIESINAKKKKKEKVCMCLYRLFMLSLKFLCASFYDKEDM